MREQQVERVDGFSWQCKRGDKDHSSMNDNTDAPSIAAPTEALKENSIERHLFSSPTRIKGSQVKSKKISRLH